MSPYDHLSRSDAALGAETPTSPRGPAPGKRTLTQSLPPVQRRALADDQRLAFDNLGADEDFVGERDTRARIEGSTDPIPNLSDRQLERARRLNPGWIRRLKVAASVFSNSAVGTNAFACDVAQKHRTSMARLGRARRQAGRSTTISPTRSPTMIRSACT